MSQETTGGRDGNRGDEGTGRPALESDAIRGGDRVVHTTDLGKEYEFRVAEVDDTWLTFENGQQVHRDRFVREEFSVVQTADADAETTVDLSVEDLDASETEGGPAAEAPAATDGGDARTPNAD